MASFVKGLRCRECGFESDPVATHVCGFCFGPLEVVYDYDGIADDISRDTVAAGPNSVWRYAPLLPELAGGESRVDLGAGLTPLVSAPRLADALGLRELWVKNDTVNPTWSFKDRVVTVALTVARQLGFDVAGCVSTGNLANSVAAHAAASGLRAYVLVPADLEQAKIATSAIYGPTLVAIDGTYDEVNRLGAEAAGEFGWAFVNVNVRPYYAEGSKTIGFEIAEQLGWRLPQQVVAPMASGSMLVKIDEAFEELIKVGLVEQRPWVVNGAQAQGCAPIVEACDEGSDRIRPVKPDTIAKSLAIGAPADGYYALDAVRRTGGWMHACSDDEIIAGMRLLAHTEGIFAETAGGVTIACLRRAIAAGDVDRDAQTVAIISGQGLKTLDALTGVTQPDLTIAPSLDDLIAALG